MGKLKQGIASLEFLLPVRSGGEKGEVSTACVSLLTNKKQQFVLTEKRLKKIECNALCSDGRMVTCLEFSFSCGYVYR